VYGFLLRPRWIVRHAIVLVAVSLFALAALWQIHRLHERRAHNAIVAARRAQPEADLDAVLRDAGSAEHRRVRASGRYDTAREVILLGRANGDRAGSHVLTPLVVRGGRALIVDRGWVPPIADSPPVAKAAPPSGSVVVHGELVEGERSPFGSGRGATKVVSLIDLNRLGRQLPYRIAPFYLRLTAQSPSQPGELPVPVKPVSLGEGSHLSYAVQWFSFIAIALIGYGAFVRHEGRRVAVQPAGEG
jgi:cytochrome oxidase assembly protein ShyY1